MSLVRDVSFGYSIANQTVGTSISGCSFRILKKVGEQNKGTGS